eukprot:scaffold205823_cov36-Tisochrysis_lutea.AAC.1
MPPCTCVPPACAGCEPKCLKLLSLRLCGAGAREERGAEGSAEDASCGRIEECTSGSSASSAEAAAARTRREMTSEQRRTRCIARAPRRT